VGPIKHHEVAVTEHAIFPKHFLRQQPFHELRFQALKGLVVQHPHHILNDVHMRQTGLEEAFIILPKPRLVPLIIHRIAGAFWEQKHRESRYDQFDKTVIRLFSTFRNRLNLLVQVGKMMVNALFEPKYEIPSLLTLTIQTFFAFSLFFSLTGTLLLSMPKICSLLCGVHLGASLSVMRCSYNIVYVMQTTHSHIIALYSTKNSWKKRTSQRFPLSLSSLTLRLYFYLSTEMLPNHPDVGRVEITDVCQFSRRRQKQ
jgi:hypothetical protein